MNQIDLSALSLLSTINKKLVSGYHVSEQDTTLWQQLDQEYPQYEALFSALGYQLIHDARGFYYLLADDSTPSMGKISRAFALTIYVLVEHYANQGKDPLAALFDNMIDLQLMQTLVIQNKHLFDQLEIFSGSELRKEVFNRMTRFGVAKETDTGYQIGAAAYRYLDALDDVANYHQLNEQEAE